MIENMDEFKEFYSMFYEKIPNSYTDAINPFFMQIGERYHISPRKCLFIGKAVNGWVTNSRNVNELFDMNNDKRIINRTDEIRWVEDLAGSKEYYNTRRSAFWRVVKNISKKTLRQDDWYNYIAWTNIYKFSPSRGNPSSRLKKMQIDICNRILDKEIEYLAPDVVIFLTSSWERPYIDHIGLRCEDAASMNWSKHKLSYQKKGNIIYIQSQHPQGKSEDDHVDAIVKVIDEFFK